MLRVAMLLLIGWGVGCADPCRQVAEIVCACRNPIKAASEAASARSKQPVKFTPPPKKTAPPASE